MSAVIPRLIAKSLATPKRVTLTVNLVVVYAFSALKISQTGGPQLDYR